MQRSPLPGKLRCVPVALSSFGKSTETTLVSRLFSLKRLRDTREKKRNLRTIYVNNQRPQDYSGQDEPFTYTSNSIRTSRVSVFTFPRLFSVSSSKIWPIHCWTQYRWWSFVPKNLFHQFRRLANFYFLINAIAMVSSELLVGLEAPLIDI